MVLQAGKNANTATHPCVSEGKLTDHAGKSCSKTPAKKNTAFDHLRSIRKRLRRTGFLQTAASVICSSWRSGTSRQYASYIARWKRYASKRGIHPVSPPVSQGVNFLAMLFRAGLSYSAICVARSALSSYFECTDCQQFGDHKRVRQFMKGDFEKRLAFPKYSWDVNLVLEYIESYYPHEKLTLRELSYKLVMLLTLLSGQRLQTLHSLSLSSLKVSDSRWVFSVDVPLKQTRRGMHLAPLEFLAFPQNNKLIVVSVLKEYVRRTKDVRGSETKLLLSHQKPHKHVSKDTLARWLRDVLSKAGVDTQQFGAHSTRVASTSAVWGPQYPCGQHSSSLGPTVPVWPAAVWGPQYPCGQQQLETHSTRVASTSAVWGRQYPCGQHIGSLGPTVPVWPAAVRDPQYPCGQHISSLGPTVPVWPAHRQFGAHSTRVASTSAVWGPQYPCGQHIGSLGPTVPVWPAHRQFGAHSTRVVSTSAVWGPQYPCGQHISSLGPTVPVWPAHQQFGAHSTRVASTSAVWGPQYPCGQHIGSGHLWCARGCPTSSCRMELGIHVFTFLQEDASCKYGTGPVGFLLSQEINK